MKTHTLTDARARSARALLALILAAPLALLTGCESGGIKGRVVEGPISVATVVENKDERLSRPGIPGVTLELRATSSTGTHPIATGTSGPDGSFSLSSTAGEAIADQLRLSARRDGYVATQGLVFIPGDGRQLLVVMKRTDSQPAAPASNPSAAPPATHDAPTRLTTPER